MTDLHASVIIPVGGSLKVLDLLPEQLNALTRQVDAPAFEVLLADNGMGPGLRKVVQRYEGALNIRIIDASDKRGAAHARNCGAAAAHSPRLLFCDADDIISRDWVREMSGEHLADSIMLSGTLVLFTSKTIPHNLMESTQYYRNSGEWEIRERHYAGANFSMMLSDYVAIQGTDESFPHGGEDLDLFFRHIEHGGQFYSLINSHIFYRMPSDNRTIFRKNYHYTRGEILLAYRQLERGQEPHPDYRWSRSFRDLAKPLVTLNHRKRMLRLGKFAGHLQGKISIRLFRRRPAPEFFDFSAAVDASE